MRIALTKMQGCGNDFVVIDAEGLPRGVLTASQARAIADRRLGVGCDQVIVLARTPVPAMRIYNPDGSEAEACGNATRCVARLLSNETGARRVTIGTAAGELTAEILADGAVRVDMGTPRLRWDQIPLAREADTLHLPLPGDPAAASMGNPHATFFLSDLATLDIAARGPSLEHDPLFPDRANIGFAQVLAPDRIRLRVWERGAGLTRACGSGACAALVNAHRRGLAERAATLLLDGGELAIEWADHGRVLMTGPAETTFTGTIDLPA